MFKTIHEETKYDFIRNLWFLPLWWPFWKPWLDKNTIEYSHFVWKMFRIIDLTVFLQHVSKLLIRFCFMFRNTVSVWIWQPSWRPFWIWRPFWNFGGGSTSIIDEYHPNNTCAKFGAFITKWTIISPFSPTTSIGCLCIKVNLLH